jgi:hypothetical protein
VNLSRVARNIYELHQIRGGIEMFNTYMGVKHRYCEVDGIRVFYREAGHEDAPVVLLPHGYPSSSFQFRNLIPALADRWHLIAPYYMYCDHWNIAFLLRGS